MNGPSVLDVLTGGMYLRLSRSSPTLLQPYHTIITMAWEDRVREYLVFGDDNELAMRHLMMRRHMPLVKWPLLQPPSPEVGCRADSAVRYQSLHGCLHIYRTS